MKCVRVWLLVLLWLPLQLFAAGEMAGRSVVLVGQVELEREGARRPLQVNEVLLVGDGVHTGSDSQVKILLEEGSVLRVAPSSSIQIAAVNSPTQPKSSVIELRKGRLRAQVSGGNGAGPGRFEVRTAVALAGVRGTDFEVLTVNPTFVRVFSGRVVVRALKAAGEVLLLANQYTRVDAARRPAKPRDIPPDTPLEERVEQELKLGKALGSRSLPNMLELIQLQQVGMLGREQLRPVLGEWLKRSRLRPRTPLVRSWLRAAIGPSGMNEQLEQLDQPRPPDAISIPLSITVPLP